MTRLFGVMGYPIGHSLSPAMHTAAFKALKIDALYAPFEVPPAVLPGVLEGLVLAGVEGLSVTVPHKEKVVPLLDRLDPVAKAMGAVNTIVIRGRKLTGYNTDGIGFRKGLEEIGWRHKAGHSMLLGAGGAARAVAWELARVRGNRLTVANRHPERARLLVRWIRRHFPGARVEAAALKQLRLDGVSLLVNATTVGSHPSDAPLIDFKQLKPGMFVYDLVYHRPTLLVAAARRRGCVASGGASMLLYQGAEAFRLWLRRKPPVQVMRQALSEALAQRGGA